MDGTIISRLATTFLVANDNAITPSTARKNLPPLAIGDTVKWQTTGDNQGVIIELYPRKNLITRPDPFNKFDKPVAANLDILLVVVASKPEIDCSLLDEYCVLAEQHQIQLIIIYNKSDLKLLGNQLETYQKIGYLTVETSVKNQMGIDELTNLLTDKIGIFVGQSGVGKSSLINQLLPDKTLKTGQLSDISQGKHTTSHSTLYPMKNGGAIIDTPGIREFGLWKLDKKEIVRGFKEIYQTSVACQFNNCQHLKEPKCAVKQAVQSGEISKKRYENYCNLTIKLL